MSPAFSEERTPSPAARSWRVTTAARVFVLALVLGQTVSVGDLGSVAVVMLGLATLTGVTCVVEHDASPAVARWAPVAEGVLAAALLGTSDAQVAPLLVYLALPPVAAGLRSGWVSVMNTALATGLAMIASYVAADSIGTVRPQIEASLPWLFAGLGTGILATWLTRSVRAIEATQAPYAAAHRLLCQLHDLSRQLPVGLDSRSTAQRMVGVLASSATASRVGLHASVDSATLHLVAECGMHAREPDAEAVLAARCLDRNRIIQASGLTALPLRVGEHVFGAVVLHTCEAVHDVEALQSTVDAQALRLDTALLFEEVRAMATTEERHRLAREIHDGVAQEVAGLGYLIDELMSMSADPKVTHSAAQLREEVTRVVSELRLSIFDLRHGVEDGDLASALSDYVRELSRRSDLRVHLLLDERDTWLHPAVGSELLRISQEAISNVRKHAHATNLWVMLTTDGEHVRLQIEDDGVGSAAPRPQRYGLQTMQERAQGVNASLHIDSRSGGGTVVTVETPAITPPERGDARVAHRASRR